MISVKTRHGETALPSGPRVKRLWGRYRGAAPTEMEIPGHLVATGMNEERIGRSARGRVQITCLGRCQRRALHKR
eukprot:scaffold28406_cov112-Isochrysis_galbana.AAC.1